MIAIRKGILNSMNLGERQYVEMKRLKRIRNTRNKPPTTKNFSGNRQYIRKQNRQWNGKKTHINRHDNLLGQKQNKTKLFPHILGRGKGKPGILFHKPPPNLVPQNNETKICKINKKRHRKLKRPANWDQKRVLWNYKSWVNPETG